MGVGLSCPLIMTLLILSWWVLHMLLLGLGSSYSLVAVYVCHLWLEGLFFSRSTQLLAPPSCFCQVKGFLPFDRWPGCCCAGRPWA